MQFKHYRLKLVLQLCLIVIVITLLVRIYDKTTEPSTTSDDPEYILLDGVQVQESLPLYSDFKNCTTKNPVTQYVPKEAYWVLENYIPATMKFRCNESVTLVTHSDISMLHHLQNIATRWKGPISVAVYDTEKDFHDIVRTIFYLRNCRSDDIKRYVTFHVFFHVNNFPGKIPSSYEFSEFDSVCNESQPRLRKHSQSRFRKTYPKTFARKVAKSLSTTYFVMSSDIRFYPSANIITEFFEMLKTTDIFRTSKKIIFAVPVFDVGENELPETKLELQSMIKSKTAIPLNKFSCKHCKSSSIYDVWVNSVRELGLPRSAVEARPIHSIPLESSYIEKAQEHVLDEHLMPNEDVINTKIIETYVMCHMGFEYYVMDNAFLMYKPQTKEPIFKLSESQTASTTKVMNEYKKRYGKSDDCDKFFINDIIYDLW